MERLEHEAVRRRLMDPVIYADGRVWRHGSPLRYRERSPGAKDVIKQYLKRKVSLNRRVFE
jgi:hypothetical protein